MEKKVKKFTPRITKQEVIDRVSIVITMKRQGYTFSQMFQFVTNPATKKKDGSTNGLGWNITEGMLRKYIVKANAYFQKTADIDRLAELGLMIERNDESYRLAYTSGDTRSLANLLRERAELLGLKKILVEHSGEIDITKKSLGELLDEFRGISKPKGNEANTSKKPEPDKSA
ncbi:MAG TPA: hypothetical protein PLE33_05865 [Candidatus Cloacimonas sp.]|nr:hypothetical protein [Candidatus Cloacimonas sp.]HPS60771.1 hypothetical protein [Candidatus Cloacimonas sp.]